MAILLSQRVAATLTHGTDVCRSPSFRPPLQIASASESGQSWGARRGAHGRRSSVPRHCHGSVAVTKSGRPEPSSRVKLVRSSVRDGEPTQRAGRTGMLSRSTAIENSISPVLTSRLLTPSVQPRPRKTLPHTGAPRTRSRAERSGAAGCDPSGTGTRRSSMTG